MTQFKPAPYSIPSRQCDGLINQVNLKSVEISDLNARLQEKVLVITALKDELRKLKGKALVDYAVTKYTIDPEMLKNDEEVAVLRYLVEHVKANYPLDHPLESAYSFKSVSANKKEPVQSWGSIVSDVPSSSLDECRKCWILLTWISEAWQPIQYTLSLGEYDGVMLLMSRGLPKLKFEKDHLCSACAMGKSKKKPHKPKSEDTNQEKLYLLHMDLCGPMRVASVNGKKYILVIVDDYSRFTWVKFLRSKDEAPDFIIKFLKMIQVRLKVTVRRIRTDNGTEFVNQTLREYYEKIGISHETFVARSPQQNGVVKRRNRTLIEAVRTMLIYAKALLFL
ncbi:retrovirus-related pol polyprotein from transposon TNT 1-94 [Tanacetum coccineum]